jgi:hypothetical protein
VIRLDEGERDFGSPELEREAGESGAGADVEDADLPTLRGVGEQVAG